MHQATFDKLKKYLGSPLLLSKPVPDEVPHLYLAISNHPISSMLVKQEGTLQKLVYYISKILHDAKTGYLRLENVYTLVISARRPCPYFQAHTITILTN